MNKIVNEWFEDTVDGERVMGVRHIPSGVCAIFDYDTKARERILEESEIRRKQLTPHNERNGHGKTLEFGKSRNGYHSVSLAAVLYAYYNNIDLRKLAGGQCQIKHYSSLGLNGQYEDCRRKSLYSTTDIVMETESRKISLTDDGRSIKVELKAYNVTEYLSNVPGMLQLIGRPSNLLFFVNRGGRTQVRIGRCPYKNNKMPYLSMVAYAVYYMGVNESNFSERMPCIMRKFQEDSFEIDHLNNDKHNNCAWNLSVIPSKMNGRSGKFDYATRIKPPYFLYMAATEGGEYRIKFGFMNHVGFGQVMHILCPDVYTLNSFLRNVMSTNKAPAFLKHYCTPKWIWSLNKKSAYASQNFKAASRNAEQLLTMDENRFIVWTADTKLVVGKGK